MLTGTIGRKIRLSSTNIHGGLCHHKGALVGCDRSGSVRLGRSDTGASLWLYNYSMEGKGNDYSLL
jgi:hypothetical protein